MSTRRIAKVAQAIRQVVSSAILTELRDPRVKNVTVLSVEVPPDLRSAKIRVSVLGDEKEARLTMKGLQSSRGFLQSRIADELQLRWTPVLSFELDESVKRSIAASRILREIAEEEEESAEQTDEADETTGLEDEQGDDEPV